MHLLYLPILAFALAPMPCQAGLSQLAAPAFTAQIIDQGGIWDYVPDDPGQVSLYADACERGAIGLLAHNYLAGRRFGDLRPADPLAVYDHNGGQYRYRVSEVRRYEIANDFGDLAEAGGPVLTQNDVFEQVYTPGRLVLQTCTGSGFLFVIAEPEPDQER